MMMPLPFREPSLTARPRWARLARWVAVLPAALAVLWSRSAYPCGIAFAPGDHASVASEEAIIVWDESSHLEQFIRSAEFRTDAKSFAFLVPTPTVPVIDEVHDDTFEFFALLMHDETETTAFDRWPSLGEWNSWNGRFPVYVGSGPAVEVLSSGTVAGLDTVVLRSRSADAVADWLGDHGFALRPALRDWLAVYVAKGWNISAFRYPGPKPEDLSQGNLSEVRSPAVRLSFSTDEPIYPYREPDDTAERHGRLLRLFTVTRRPVAPLLDGQEGAPWQAGRVFAKRVAGRKFGLNPRDVIPVPQDSDGQVWLTEFLDRATKRPPVDVTFGASPSLGEVAPVKVTHRTSNLFGLFEVALVAAVFGGLTAGVVAGVTRLVQRLLGMLASAKRSTAGES